MDINSCPFFLFEISYDYEMDSFLRFLEYYHAFSNRSCFLKYVYILLKKLQIKFLEKNVLEKQT